MRDKRSQALTYLTIPYVYPRYLPMHMTREVTNDSENSRKKNNPGDEDSIQRDARDRRRSITARRNRTGHDGNKGSCFILRILRLMQSCLMKVVPDNSGPYHIGIGRRVERSSDVVSSMIIRAQLAVIKVFQ